MKNLRWTHLVLAFIIVYIIIAVYFYGGRSVNFYGDDLIASKYHENQPTLWGKINANIGDQKFRPVQGLVQHWIMIAFHGNSLYYYFFNVFVQALDAVLLFAILNMFLQAPLVSFTFCLMFAISRLTAYNITQLIFGGSLEALVTGFFLMTLYLIVKAIKVRNQPANYYNKIFLWCILLTNLAFYTHERYIVLFPFIIMVMFLFHFHEKFNVRKKLLLSALCVFSIAVNAYIKIGIYKVPFFKGTGSSNITFSLTSTLTYLQQAVYSIVGVNMGAPNMTGLQYDDLSPNYVILEKLFIFPFVAVVGFYIVKLTRSAIKKENDAQRNLMLYFCLICLFFALLVPAIVSVRIEQRWLQASFCILVIAFAIALNNIGQKISYLKYILSAAAVILFVSIDAHYYYKSLDYYYFREADRSVGLYIKAVNTGVIKQNTKALYVYQKQFNVDEQCGIRWVIDDGYLFHFLGGKYKDLFFIDSTSNHSVSAINDSAQIIYVHRNSVDTVEIP